MNGIENLQPSRLKAKKKKKKREIVKRLHNQRRTSLLSKKLHKSSFVAYRNRRINTSVSKDTNKIMSNLRS